MEKKRKMKQPSCSAFTLNKQGKSKKVWPRIGLADPHPPPPPAGCPWKFRKIREFREASRNPELKDPKQPFLGP